jgi:hypothetical protein
MRYFRPWMPLHPSLAAVVAVTLVLQNFSPQAAAQPPKTQSPNALGAAKAAGKAVREGAQTAWKDLFDGKTLAGWKVLDLGGDGKLNVKDGTIVLNSGSPMTGIAYKGEVLKNNYELSLEGMRLGGSDFFCTTTFPVGKDPCTLVVGGWGGQVVGLSNVDHFDASENATTKTMEFKDKQWYRVRIRVSDAAIQAWIDDKLMVNQPREEHKFSIRIEVDECRPLGIATWYTTGAVRKIRVRPLSPAEVRESAAAAKAAEDGS